MIKLNDDFSIIIDEYQYILVKSTGKTIKVKNKEYPVYNYLGYYSSFKNALNGYREICIRKRLNTGLFDITEVIGIIKEEDEKIKKLFKKMVKVSENNED